MNSNLISIGKVLNFHGIKGEVKVGYTKGKERLISELKKAFLISIKNPSQVIEVNVETVRFHKQHALIKFTEIKTLNDAEEVKGFDIKIPKNIAESYLEDDEFLITDLTGLDVFDNDGALIGNVESFSQNAGNDLLHIKDGNGKIHYVPFAKELVPVVDIKNRKIIINNIEGLIE